MTYQQMSFFDEPESELESLPVFQGASRASRTRLQECVNRLLMNVTCGRSTGESLARLSLDGSWQKMYGDYCQVNLAGSTEEYSEILPTWGMMLAGVVIGLPTWERFIPESELQLLPTIVASDSGLAAVIGKEDSYKMTSNGTLRKINRKGTDGSLGLTRTLRLLPTLTASEYKGVAKNRFWGSPTYRGDKLASRFRKQKEDLTHLNPDYAELFMGFPMGWTVLKPLEMQ